MFTFVIFHEADKKSQKFPYTRPVFLGLTTEDELQVCSDHSIRPILVPRDLNILPWSTGYAELVAVAFDLFELIICINLVVFCFQFYHLELSMQAKVYGTKIKQVPIPLFYHFDSQQTI